MYIYTYICTIIHMYKCCIYIYIDIHIHIDRYICIYIYVYVGGFSVGGQGFCAVLRQHAARPVSQLSSKVNFSPESTFLQSQRHRPGPQIS